MCSSSTASFEVEENSMGTSGKSVKTIIDNDICAPMNAPTDSWVGSLKVIIGKPAQTILLVVMMAGLPLFIPRLGSALSLKGQSYREMLPNPHELISFRRVEQSQNSGELPGGSAASENSQATHNEEKIPDQASRLISDPSHALDSFYAKLARTDARESQAITRIAHYGDSPVTNDGTTAPVRRLLQERFGDAGHGFILIDKPWVWYGHQAITFTSNAGWTIDTLASPGVGDGAFGLGGASFRSTDAGKYVRFAPASGGDTGKNFSRMDVYFLRQSNGGQFTIDVNGSNEQTVTTVSEVPESGFWEIKAPQNGANTFEIRTKEGRVRLFGAVLENDGPGVVYDSLGINGASARLLVTVMNEQHWIAQLQHRRPDLVILNYGTNESEAASDSQVAVYERDLLEVVRRVREALPDASILILSPMDRGTHVGGKVITLPSIPKIVDMQRRVALESNCAFLNLFEAMGGEGTMARWHEGRTHLVGGDLTHPTGEGAETIGKLIFQAIINGYEQYQARVDSEKRQLVTTK